MPLFADRNPSAYVICIRYMYGFLQAERSIRRATRQASAPPPVIDGLSHEDRMRTGRHSASATRGDSGGRELAQVPMMSVWHLSSKLSMQRLLRYLLWPRLILLILSLHQVVWFTTVDLGDK